MTIVLNVNNDEVQTTTLRDLFEVENLFADEDVMSYVFAEALDDETSPSVTTPQFSYA